jgi:hypothetical protein
LAKAASRCSTVATLKPPGLSLRAALSASAPNPTSCQNHTAETPNRLPTSPSRDAGTCACPGSPGYTGTKMATAIPKEVLDSKIRPQIPVARLGKPDEVAGLIIYLCSEEAAFVTGANIPSTAASICSEHVAAEVWPVDVLSVTS